METVTRTFALGTWEEQGHSLHLSTLRLRKRMQINALKPAFTGLVRRELFVYLRTM